MFSSVDIEKVTREEIYKMSKGSPVKKFLLDNGLDYKDQTPLPMEILNEYYEIVVKNQDSFDEMVTFMDSLDRRQNLNLFGKYCYLFFLDKKKDLLMKDRYDSVVERCNKGDEKFRVNNDRKLILVVD